jgi:hypothetical protein
METWLNSVYTLFTVLIITDATGATHTDIQEGSKGGMLR